MVDDIKEFPQIRQISSPLYQSQKNKLAKRVKPFTLKDGIMYELGQDNNLHRFITMEETQKIFKELHEGIA